MVRILAIGDPHGALDKIKKIPIKDVDLILLPGDLGGADEARKFYFENVKRQERGLSKIKYSSAIEKKFYAGYYKSSMNIIKYLSKFALIYLIYGNADYYNSDVRKLSKRIGKELPFMYNNLKKIPSVRIINNKIANFKGLRIGGLEYFKDVNWVRDFKPKDYDKEMKRAKKDTAKAKRILGNFKNLDILLCHQPLYGILDKVGFKGAPKQWLGKHAGSKVILGYVKKKQPKYVLCGHIHEAKGRTKIGKTEVINLGASGDYVIISVQ